MATVVARQAQVAALDAIASDGRCHGATIVASKMRIHKTSNARASPARAFLLFEFSRVVSGSVRDGDEPRAHDRAAW